MLNPDQEAVVTVAIDSAANLYGLELHLKFDSTVIQVVDSDNALSGVQMHPGDIFDVSQSFLVVNQVDQDSGEITYAITLLAPAPPETGDGSLITFKLHAIDIGNSALELVNVIMASPDGEAVPFNSIDGQVVVNTEQIKPPPPTQIPVSSPTPLQPNTEIVASTLTGSPSTTLTPLVSLLPTDQPSSVISTSTSIPIDSITSIPQPRSTEGTIMPSPSLKETLITQSLMERHTGIDLATSQRPEGELNNRVPQFVSLALPIYGVLVLLGIALFVVRKTFYGRQ